MPLYHAVSWPTAIYQNPCFPSLGLYIGGNGLAVKCLLRWKLTEERGNDPSQHHATDLLHCQAHLWHLVLPAVPEVIETIFKGLEVKRMTVADEFILQCNQQNANIGQIISLSPAVKNEIKCICFNRVQCSPAEKVSSEHNRCQHSNFSSFAILKTPQSTLPTFVHSSTQGNCCHMLVIDQSANPWLTYICCIKPA